MDALLINCDGPGSMSISREAIPEPLEQEALIKVRRAGICNTDLELMKGYMGFKGIVGHEFVGEVVKAPSESGFIQGDRVVGDINLTCSSCDICSGVDRHRARNHCPKRTVLGILNKSGTYAQYLTLPVVNLHKVPDSLRDKAAVFTEPLAAACRILEQKLVKPSDVVVVIGDGKLGILIAHVLASIKPTRLILIGHHESKLSLAPTSAERRVVYKSDEAADLRDIADVVVEVSGSPAGLMLASEICRPLGTVVLKTTCAAGADGFNSAPFVIKELKVIGSRCGPFDEALKLLQAGLVPTDELTSAELPFSEVEQAVKLAAEKSSLKVQLVMSDEK